MSYITRAQHRVTIESTFDSERFEGLVNELPLLIAQNNTHFMIGEVDPEDVTVIFRSFELASDTSPDVIIEFAFSREGNPANILGYESFSSLVIGWLEQFDIPTNFVQLSSNVSVSHGIRYAIRQPTKTW